MNWISKLFGDKTQNEIKPKLNLIEDEPWVKFEDEKPPHEVVLATCDTYDCGWSMDTVWWYEDKNCWMTTGSVVSEEAHLPYTHWRKLPKYPMDN